MKLVLNSNSMRKALFLVAPLMLLGSGSSYAQDSYYDGGHAEWHHQHEEKHALKHHQQDEREYYGDSWELRQHQREERRELHEHHDDERGYWDRYNGYGRDDRSYYGDDDRYYRRGYSGRPY